MGAKARFVDGSWWVFTNYRRQRRAKKLGAVTREVAHQVAADINLKLAREDYKLPPKRGTALRFAELAQEWIATYPAVRTLAANTRNNYEWFIREHLIPYFGNMAVTDIDYQTVEAFIALKRSPKGSTRYTGQPIGDHSLRVGVVTLAMILDRAIKVHKLITVNPARGVARFTRPADDDRVDPFTPEELRLILSAAVATDFELATFLRVWMQTGLRLGEVCGLQHQDLDLRRGLVLVRRTYSPGHSDRATYQPGPSKTRRSRTVALTHPITETTSEWRPNITDASRRVLEDLRRLPSSTLGPTAYLFGGETPWTSWRVSYRWQGVVKAAKVRYRNPEQLRHTFASTLLSRNAPLLYVQQQGGWKSAAVLLRVYARWIEQALPAPPELPSFESDEVEEKLKLAAPTIIRTEEPARR